MMWSLGGGEKKAKSIEHKAKGACIFCLLCLKAPFSITRRHLVSHGELCPKSL